MTGNSLNLSSSLEDYLEAILDLYEQNGRVRTTDLGASLHVEKSSVNSAVNKLKNFKLVEHEKYEDIRLTARGENEARRVKKRHEIIFKFLHVFLGVTESEAKKDACRIEHAAGPVTIYKLSKFIEYIEMHPLLNNEKWFSSFSAFAGKNNFSDTPDL
ncbi:MAG: hypothetical protein A2096_00025 [Spirochaetes bacterium GWF1_41_5]|nr:MAG: hypothetical protein A2096_00025 [Spirochaetes bacterium GWF1_41_5]